MLTELGLWGTDWVSAYSQLRGQAVSSLSPFLAGAAGADDGYRASIREPELSHIVEPDRNVRESHQMTGEEGVSVVHLPDSLPTELRSLFLLFDH